MAERGVLLLGEDAKISEQAKAHKLACIVREEPSVPWQKTLIVTPGTTVPWDLLPAAWRFLDKWDAAVPLWRYGETAEDVGTPSERKRTRDVVRDLRVLLYSHELLFVRKNEAGETLVATWVDEMGGGGEPRLAFLRSFYRVKPMLCVLPRTWLQEIATQARQATGRSVRPRHRRSTAGEPLIQIEVAPGVTVQCRESEEDGMRKRWAKRFARRHEGVR